jgi:hypothetical protein
MSSLTQDTGTLRATTAAISSYKGNNADAPTVLIMYL